jgi:hypothetical protein
MINDAAMQALGSYKSGVMLFLGFGTGLSSAIVAEGVVVPMELGHLSFKHGSYEDYATARQQQNHDGHLHSGTFAGEADGAKPRNTDVCREKGEDLA